MVAWWINLGVNTAATQMSLHVEYFKRIQGPWSMCGSVLDCQKTSSRPFIPSSLWLSWPLHHILTPHHPRLVHFQLFCAAK